MFVTLTLTNFLLSQSCHIGEEDEGGEQNGEEPSFEVRQTEMVWGEPGDGTRGELAKIAAAAPPPRREPHKDTTLGTPPRPSPPPTTLLSLTFCQVVPVVYSSCSGGLTCACLCWTQQSDQCNGLNCMT